ncbi:MAG: HAD-IC family P-type ATPase [bacterium]|nr:HAD-IC family P-type ATPase [bacterium]
MPTFHTISFEQIFAELHTSPGGLSSEEAKRRLAEFGPNAFPQPPKPSVLLEFLSEFKSGFVYVLFAAGGISVAIGHNADAMVIGGIVIANAIVGFLQRRKAERAIEALEKMLVSTAQVLRDGELARIPSRNIVPGDIIMIVEGDKVSADARILKAENMRVDESGLTGESVPEDKSEGMVSGETPLADRTNMVYMGTSAVTGEGRAIVTATGFATEFGKIASAMRLIRRERTHFEKRIDQLALHMGMLAFAGTVITFGVGFFVRKMAFLEIFIFSIATLVSGIPEGLPAVVAVVLAIGASRMAKRNAIVRRLAAVETLGVATTILTDKTGTLTQNTMTVEEILLADNNVITITGSGWGAHGEFLKNGSLIDPTEEELLRNVLQYGTIINTSKVLRKNSDYEIIGDPTEAALVVLAEKAGITQDRAFSDIRILGELPFDRATGWRARLVEHGATGKRFIGVVGAWERIMAVSTASADLKTAHEERIASMASQAMRVLAVAWKEVDRHAETLSQDMIRDVTLGGFYGMRDPLRLEARDAVGRAKAAGIRVVMQTGDHPATALAIAKEAGIADAAARLEIATLTEAQLEKLSDTEFKKALATVNVFARVTPTAKLRIVKTLQELGEVVAVTGDGVNDAPALKQADIGVAMGQKGTDVAKEASEIVLADDNFSSIVAAIEEGRIVFSNTRKTSYYLLTTNIAEYCTIVSTLLLGMPLPLLPTQVLWLNLVTDGPPVIALAAEPGEDNVLAARPRKAEEPIIAKNVIPFMLITAFIMTAGTLLLFRAYMPDGLDKARTMAFTAMALFQIVNALNLSSLTQSIFRFGLNKGNRLWQALVLAALMQFAVIAIPPIRDAFHLTSLSIAEWGLVLFVSLSILLSGEIYKATLRARHKRS